jgi:hypothetical protein
VEINDNSAMIVADLSGILGQQLRPRIVQLFDIGKYNYISYLLNYYITKLDQLIINSGPIYPGVNHMK